MSNGTIHGSVRRVVAVRLRLDTGEVRGIDRIVLYLKLLTPIPLDVGRRQPCRAGILRRIARVRELVQAGCCRHGHLGEAAATRGVRIGVWVDVWARVGVHCV